MPRSLWKGPFIDSYLLKLIKFFIPSDHSKHIVSSKKNIKSKIKVWSRRSLIIPEFLDQSFEIYNGKTFIALKVNEDMIGHKFGEFSSTRKKTIHKNKLKK